MFFTRRCGSGLLFCGHRTWWAPVEISRHAGWRLRRQRGTEPLLPGFFTLLIHTQRRAVRADGLTVHVRRGECRDVAVLGVELYLLLVTEPLHANRSSVNIQRRVVQRDDESDVTRRKVLRVLAIVVQQPLLARNVDSSTRLPTQDHVVLLKRGLANGQRRRGVKLCVALLVLILPQAVALWAIDDLPDLVRVDGLDLRGGRECDLVLDKRDLEHTDVIGLQRRHVFLQRCIVALRVETEQRRRRRVQFSDVLINSV